MLVGFTPFEARPSWIYTLAADDRRVAWQWIALAIAEALTIVLMALLPR